MIHLVGPQQRHIYRDYLESMFELRYATFIVERGWDLPNDGRTEIDQFDHDDAIYALSIDINANRPKVDGCFRYIDTSARHMMPEIFPHLCSGGSPHGPDLGEWSRLAVDMAKRSPGQASRIFRNISLALVELAMLRGHTKIIFVADEEAAARTSMIWPGLERLGPTYESNGEMISAWSLKISLETLRFSRNLNKRTGPILIQLTNPDDLALWIDTEKARSKVGNDDHRVVA